MPAKYHPQHVHRAKINYDRKIKSLPEITVGSTVRIQENNSWPVKGKVVEKKQCSEIIYCGNRMGTERRRNREQFLVTKEQFERVPSDLEDGNHSASSSDNHVLSTNTNTSTTSERNDTNYRCRLRATINPDRYGFSG